MAGQSTARLASPSAFGWFYCYFALIMVCFSASAYADSWLPAQPRTYTAPNGALRLTVTPREISNQLRYFADASRNKTKPGQKAGAPEQATFRLERRDSAQNWQLVSSGPLVNDVAPVHAIVANDGSYFVTLDNWHSMGFGDNAVAIYRSDGALVRKLALVDFMPESYVKALPRSVSSLHWRKGERIDETAQTVVIDVVIPSQQVDGELTGPGKIEARLSLIDGSLQNGNNPNWLAAMDLGATEARRLEAETKRQRAEFLAPLLAPAGSDERAWHLYLVEVFFRIDPDWSDGYPNTEVLRDPKRTDYTASEKWLREALLQTETNADVIAIASPASQDNLVAVLTKIAPRMKAGSLASARIYVAADQAHGRQITDLLSRSQANVIILDPTVPIPQRAARIEGTPEFEQAQQESRKRTEKDIEAMLAQ